MCIYFETEREQGPIAKLHRKTSARSQRGRLVTRQRRRTRTPHSPLQPARRPAGPSMRSWLPGLFPSRSSSSSVLRRRGARGSPSSARILGPFPLPLSPCSFACQHQWPILSLRDTGRLLRRFNCQAKNSRSFSGILERIRSLI